MQMSEFESKGRNHARLGILAQFSYWDHQGEQQGNLAKEGAWAKLNCCRWASSERTAVIVQENEFNKGKPPSALWGNGGGEVPCEQDPAYQSLQLKKKNCEGDWKEGARVETAAKVSLTWKPPPRKVIPPLSAPKAQRGLQLW